MLSVVLLALSTNALVVEKRQTKSINLPGTHKPVQALYAAGTPLPSGHPKVASLYAGFLPTGHPKLDTLMANPKANPLPKGHPSLDSFSGGAAKTTGTVPAPGTATATVPAPGTTVTPGTVVTPPKSSASGLTVSSLIGSMLIGLCL